jgi:hypothetical protein
LLLMERKIKEKRIDRNRSLAILQRTDTGPGVWPRTVQEEKERVKPA